MSVCFSLLSYLSLFPSYTTITTLLLFFSHNFFASNNTCSLDRYSKGLQTLTFLFTRNLSSHTTDWIATTHCRLLCLELLLSHTFNVMNVLKFSTTLLELIFCLLILYTLVAFVYVALSLSISFIHTVFGLSRFGLWMMMPVSFTR